MRPVSDADYSAFDQPDILEVLFHPRGDFSIPSHDENTHDVFFDVAENVRIGSRFHAPEKTDPVILFFHGNGEIVSDYDDLGPFFTRMGLGFFAFDYRGYGRSTGKPTVTAMMSDSLRLFDQAVDFLKANGYSGSLIVMGRSLGSASALEIAANRTGKVDGLIIESGFAFMMPLLELLGLTRLIPGVSEENGPMNSEKIRRFSKPTLVIHAQYDHIIPFSDGLTLYDNSGAQDKTLLEVKGADHNNIFMVGFQDYMNAVKTLGDKLR